MSATATATGFYGKLPCRGDFLQRRVPQQFVDAWDAWLQECMHVSREQLQEAWLDRYLTGPIWRFVLSAGVCGDGAHAGILVPSVDRVGRYFPLTIVAPLDARYCPLDIACSAGPWFEAAEALVLDALAAEQLDVDQFDEQVAQLGQSLAAEEAAEASALMLGLRDSPFPMQPARWHVPLQTAQSLQRAINVLAYREISRSLQPVALWWTEGSSALGASWLSTRGLPEPQCFAAMLSGDWVGSSWTSVAPVVVDPIASPLS
jgi:type VI secretion system protein ImpM